MSDPGFTWDEPHSDGRIRITDDVGGVYMASLVETRLIVEHERLQARVAKLEADPRMALTYDDLAYCAAATRHDSHLILDPAGQRWARLVAAREAALAAVSAEKEAGRE